MPIPALPIPSKWLAVLGVYPPTDPIRRKEGAGQGKGFFDCCAMCLSYCVSKRMPWRALLHSFAYLQIRELQFDLTRLSNNPGFHIPAVSVASLRTCRVVITLVALSTKEEDQKVLNQRGVPNACVQYTPISLLRLTAKATPISVNIGFIRLAQCFWLLIQPATASSGFICPPAMFSPIAR